MSYEGRPKQGDIPHKPSRPAEHRSLLSPWSRRPGVLVDSDTEFLARPFDGTRQRIGGTLLGLALFAIGGSAYLAKGGAKNIVIGLIIGTLFGIAIWGTGYLKERQRLSIRDDRLRTRGITGWKPSVDLNQVLAACYTTQYRAGEVMQLLNREYGTLPGSKAQRWSGLQPEPTAPDGSTLHSFTCRLGNPTRRGAETSAAVLAHLAPYLLRPSVQMDDRTRAVLEAAARGGAHRV